MAILADWQIRRLEGMIRPYVPHQVRVNEAGAPIISYGESSFGYDIRVGQTFDLFTSGLDREAVIDPKQLDSRLLRRVVVPPSEAVWLPPHSFALAPSMERFHLPRHVTGVAIGKSTYARANIICPITPLEAGWEGTLTIEIHNPSTLPAKVYACEGIVQIQFFAGEEPMVSYADRGGKYQGQVGITLPRV